jgi:hypothetical protein
MWKREVKGLTDLCHRGGRAEINALLYNHIVRRFPKQRLPLQFGRNDYAVETVAGGKSIINRKS